MFRIHCERVILPGSADRISSSGCSFGEVYAVAHRPKAIVQRMLVFMVAESECQI